MAKRKFYSIKYPFTAEDRYRLYVDLNKTKYDSIRSDITHLLFTPTGSRLRDPKFGSNLIKKIFMPSDDLTFDDIKAEIQGVVKEYIPHVTITSMTATPTDEGRGIRIKMDYKVDEGSFYVDDALDITI
jgi:phage baseplate assembly protein W